MTEQAKPIDHPGHPERTDRIDVTQPYLPPLEEFTPYLERIWASRQLTNGGAMHVEFERALADYLGVAHISLLANGTLALMVTLEALQSEGEVITTAFSFVATAHALSWKKLKPVFADIDAHTHNHDPGAVERAITPQTRAILAVHTYGQPADIVALQGIADRHGLQLIYDAAHSFGVRDAGGSILRHGDASILSFHATKVFTTFEGGAIVCRDADLKKRVDRLKNFGFGEDGSIADCGINAKMNEVQAAFGLLQLRHVDHAIGLRRRLDARYRERLSGIDGVRLIPLLPGVTQNYSYFPILIEAGFRESRDALLARMQQHGIFARRYFYPLLSNIERYCSLPSAQRDNLPVSNRSAQSVLCLPISPNLGEADVDRIVSVIAEASHG